MLYTLQTHRCDKFFHVNSQVGKRFGVHPIDKGQKLTIMCTSHVKVDNDNGQEIVEPIQNGNFQYLCHSLPGGMNHYLDHPS